ncbi:MAG: GNAT family N-acetyltransferase [Granulosicoccus sp.]|nr:GNAT family N-acetyltransferase [Granulosicoccus sp.]
MDFSIQPATKQDAAAIHQLLPRLAAFDVPEGRNPDDLWHGDRALLEAWEKDENDCQVLVATDASGVIGVAMVTLREELLSHEPSAHLEVLALSVPAQGRGIGKALLKEAQRIAADKGAKSMSLHVFANNTRARALYEREGFSGELLRYYKPL